MEHFFLRCPGRALWHRHSFLAFPVAFALSGSAIISILLAAGSGYLFAGDVDAFFAQGGPGQWLSAGVTNLRGIYWEPERDTLIAIPMFIFMGIMLQRSKIAGRSVDHYGATVWPNSRWFGYFMWCLWARFWQRQLASWVQPWWQWG